MEKENIEEIALAAATPIVFGERETRCFGWFHAAQQPVRGMGVKERAHTKRTLNWRRNCRAQVSRLSGLITTAPEIRLVAIPTPIACVPGLRVPSQPSKRLSDWVAFPAYPCLECDWEPLSRQ
jgi:hypothetical protein